jgi:hypothetical protein
MIVSIQVDWELAQKQADYQAEISDGCPRCQAKTWGHGRVFRWFEGLCQPLAIPMRRCPICGCVVTGRPASHRPRHQGALRWMGQILCERLSLHKWPDPELRQRAGHWLRRFYCWFSTHRDKHSVNPCDLISQCIQDGVDFMA